MKQLRIQSSDLSLASVFVLYIYACMRHLVAVWLRCLIFCLFVSLLFLSDFAFLGRTHAFVDGFSLTNAPRLVVRIIFAGLGFERRHTHTRIHTRYAGKRNERLR
jgi:hypothetical protein